MLTLWRLLDLSLPTCSAGSLPWSLNPHRWQLSFYSIETFGFLANMFNWLSIMIIEHSQVTIIILVLHSRLFGNFFAAHSVKCLIRINLTGNNNHSIVTFGFLASMFTWLSIMIIKLALVKNKIFYWDFCLLSLSFWAFTHLLLMKFLLVYK